MSVLIFTIGITSCKGGSNNSPVNQSKEIVSIDSITSKVGNDIPSKPTTSVHTIN